MKKVLFMLTMFASFITSCSERGNEDSAIQKPTPQPEETTSITLNSDIVSKGLIFNEQGGEMSVEFSTNKDWTLDIAATTDGSNWCSVSKKSGTKGDVTVNFSVTENKDYNDRSVSVTIKAGTASKTFKVIQKGVDALLVTSTTFEIPQEGGIIDVEVKANITYQLEVCEAAKSWISKNKGRALTAEKHSFTIAASEECEKREGEIYIKSGNKLETVKVYQAGGAILMLSKDEYVVSDKGEIIYVDIKSNIDYGVQMPSVDWIYDLASVRGASSHTLQYVVDANNTYDIRSTEIIFYDKNSDLKDTLKVHQTQKDAIVLSKTEYNMSIEGGTLDFEVSSNVNFDTEISVEWIKQVTASRGLQSKQLHFIIEKNTTLEKREGTISFVYNDLKQIAKVIQDGDGIPYITFIAEDAQTLKMSKAIDNLQYSVNGSEWKSLETNSISFGGNNGNLRLRGKSTIGTAISTHSMEHSKIYFLNNTPVACYGDIRTLVDYENYDNVDTSNARFCHLFSGCENLTSAPELPSKTLAESCYYDMFAGCTNLTTTPELPATTLAELCYYGMFIGCTNLTTTPELPATTLTAACYSAMFEGCIGLTTTPELPATTLTFGCYSAMFKGCTNLTTTPELPATILAPKCYSEMFKDCTNLKTVTQLGTMLDNNCFTEMFSGCSNLTSAPELPATTLAPGCYSNMFVGCTSLTSAPELPATTLAPGCYSNMFEGCTSLTSAPELPATKLAEGCYSGMFYKCNKLVSAPNLSALTLERNCYSNMFSYCTNLTKAPEISAISLSYRCCDGMFSYCTSLIIAPILRAEYLKQECYRSMFEYCIKLEQVTMLAIDISASGCLDYWLHGVSSTGVLTKSSTLTTLLAGSSGIPHNWTVVDYEESND